MSQATKDKFFKSGFSARDKAENTTMIARAINDAELKLRDEKTARLRALRLQREAAEQQAATVAVSEAPASTPARKRRSK